jgi:hypothetical protein
VDAQPIRLRWAVSTTPATSTAIRPFHEAMSRQARRARHSWQVFGLAGTHQMVLCPAPPRLVPGRGGAGQVPSGRRFPVGGPEFPIPPTSAYDGGRSCIPLRDSPGLSPGSLLRRMFHAPLDAGIAFLRPFMAFRDVAGKPAA